MAVFDDMEKDFQQTAVQPQQAARGPFTSSAMQEPSVEDLEREMAEMGYRQGHDSEGILPMLYHTGAGVIGKTLEDIGGFMAYGGKPSYMTEKEWDKKAQDAGGLAAVANAINAGIRDYGREISEAHQRNYTPYSAKWFANSLGYLIPSAVQLAAVKKTGMFEPSAGEKMMLEGAGNVIANAASKVPVMAKYAPKIGSVAAGLAENATIGAKEAFPEAFMEAEDAKNSYIEKAKMNKTYVPEQTEREAEEVSKKVLMDNIAFITSTDTLQNYIMDRISGGKGSAMQKMGRAALAGAPVGFTEETGQGIIQKEAAGEPWKLSDPDIGGAGLVGAIAGSFPTGARMAMDYAGNKYMERQQAKNIKNMGQGEAITEQPTEAEEVTGTDNIRNMAESMDEDNSGNPPTPPGADGILKEQAAPMPSFEETRDNSWVLNNDTVHVDNLQDITKAGIGNIAAAFKEMTGQPLIITSGTDGAGDLHMDGTYSHGTGYKIDVSGNGLEDPETRHRFIAYCEAQGIKVLDEYEHPSPNSTGGHLDLEFHEYNGNGQMAGRVANLEGEFAAEEPPADVFAEFAVPENAFSDNPAAEELFPANREQQQAEAPAEMAAQQDAQEAAMAAEQGIIEPAENFMDDNLPPEIKSFNRAQLVDFAKGIQAIKRRFEAKKMSAEEALQARDNLFNRIASKRPETAQKAQNVPANVVNNPLPANMIQQAPQNQATAPNRATVPAVNNTATVPQNTATQDRFQEAAERFNNDPALLQRVAKAARQRLKEMHEAGQMTDDQLQANIAELGNSFRQIKKRMTQNNRKAQQPTGQGRQARLPMGMMEANAKAAMQRAKQAGIKEKDIPMLTRITKAAATGNQAAISQFSKLRPEVRQAMQDIITGALPVNDALRSRRETPALEAPAENTAVMQEQTAQQEQSKPEQKQETAQGKQAEAEQVKETVPEKTAEREQQKETAAEQTEEVKEETKTEPVKEETKAAEQEAKAPERKETAADNLDDKVNKLIEKEFKDPEERELASSIFLINPDDAKGEWASWRKSYRDELNKILAPVMKVLRGGMKQGVEFVRMEGERDAKYNRVSQNAEWYRNFYKENKRAPKDSIEAAERDGHITTELEDIAIDVLTGKRKDVIPEYASETPEAKAENNKNSLEISDILHNIEMLDNIRDGVFKIADALNSKPAETKPAAKPEKTVQAPAGKKKIEDFGQKIGGARKDMYVKGEKAKPAAKPKTEKKTDDSLKDKPWLKDYDIKQGENGKWTVTDKKEEEKRKRNSFIFAWYNGNKRAIEKLFFDTKEAAQKAATLDAVSQKHTVFSTNEKGNFCISRKIGGRDGHWVQIKDGFATRDEAMTYMANHPEEIMSIRTSYGESDLATPVIHGWNDARSDKAPERLKKGQNATEDMFTDTFGFRGVQFGNWQNQTERQALMNAAYEGMMDLADVLGVDPKIVSLNGELGLAFGARGKGLTGARAHYEPAYTVINLTKMKGAGSLAHEWMHALDHYLMLKSGTIKGDRTDEGRLTDPNFAELASEVSSWRFKSDNLNPDLLAAFKKLKDTAFYKEVAETQDEADAQEWVNRTSSRMDEELNKIRQYVANERKYGSKKAPATAEQLQRFDELATKIAAGDEQLTVNHKYHTWTTPTMEKLSDLFKEITGKSLLKMEPDDRFIRLVSLTDTLQEKRKKLAEAQAKVEKKKRVPTAYYRNNTDLDRGRTSNYWTRPTEMLARAFSAFVEDTVNEKGYNSEFLSYGSDNKYFMWGNPFPEGKEREAINSAFKDFIGEVQKEVARNKEATGEIKFSIRAAANEAKNEIPNTEKKRQIRAKEELEKSEPVITIKRDDELPQLEDKALRSRAKEMFRQLYPETDRRPYSTTTKYGEEIYIPMSGFKELRNHSADNRVMYIVPHLETILNNSTYLFTPEDKAFKIYGCKAMINGQECYVRSVVRRRDDGKYYYDGDVSTVEDIKNKSPLPSNEPGPKPGIAAEKDSYPENSIPYWMDRVNEWENDPALAENEDTRRNDLTDDAVRLSGESINRAVSDVIAEVQEAFPGAKDVKTDGTDITFTMPNGLQMRVKIKEQILLSDSEAAKARKAHGLKEDADITVEGSTRKLDKGSVIELSQESSKGTAFHEAFHTVMDWVLNAKEKAALSKYYGPKAKEQGKSLDEVLADAYKEWQQARKQKRGTLFGKLWQKLKDFARKAQAILTGTENVHNIFRQIETGDVWTRSARNEATGTGETQYSIRDKLEEATKPEQVQYGNNDTAFGRATQVISAKTEKSLFQKGLDAVKNLYFQMVDEDTHAHKVDQKVEAKTGKKLSADESFYNQVRETGSISRGHAEALIAGTKAHAETVQSRIRNKYLKEQFDPEATLSNMMDIIDPVKMNEKHGDFLAKHNLKDWQQALDTYLAAHRLKEMYSLAMADYNVKHKKWQERKNAAWKAGKEFTEKEPMPYRLPGKLTIADLDAAIKAAPPELEQAAKVYYAFNKNLTILLADAGLLKPELYQMLNTKYKRYCPLMRDFSDTAAADDFIGALGKGGSSVVNVSNPLKEILEEGSKRNLLSPLESTIKACAIYCDRAERNKVGQKAVKMAQDYKLDDLIWRVDGKKAADPKNCIFTVMINGQKVAFQCTQDLYEPIVGAPEQVADMLFSLASLPAKTLRYGATISPTFAIRNMIRDTVFAGIASKNGFIPIYDTIRGFMALRNNPELKAKFDAMGISMQTFYGNEMTARTKLQDLQVKEIDNLWDFAKEIIKYPMEKLEAFSEMSEQSTRMGEFMRAIEKGKSLEEAARDARNLTIDFSRHGRTGKKLNQIIPFFNAAIQGGDLMARLLYNDPAGTLLKLGKYIVLPSMALWCLNKDDDWWKELDPDLKNSYWFVKTPKGIVRVPKPQEAGVLFGSGMEALLEQATKRDPEAMANWADAFRGAITPNYLATVISPLLENAANYSFFRNKPIVGRANEKKPGEQQFTRGTSELSKMLGASPIAHAYNKGGYSPSKIDNLISGYTGTMGMLLWQGAGEAANKARGIENQSPEKKISEMPFVREFLVNDYNMSRSLNDFYDLAAEAEAHHNAHGKKGHPSPAVAFVRKARADIAKERKAIQEITSSRRLTPEQKRQLIDKRQNKINIIAKGTLKRYQGKF